MSLLRVVNLILARLRMAGAWLGRSADPSNRFVRSSEIAKALMFLRAKSDRTAHEQEQARRSQARPDPLILRGPRVKLGTRLKGHER